MIARKLGYVAVIAMFFMPAAAQAAEWGTIAFSPSTWAYGWTANRVNEVDAELGALNNCAKHADDCITGINFHDTCASVAVGDNRGWGSAGGYDDADAAFNAIDQCSKYDVGCETLRTQCSW